MSRDLHSITKPAGFLTAGVSCGIKPSGKPDLAVIVCENLCWGAGVFTRSLTPAEPVRVNQRKLARGRNGIVQGIVVNSGNANAATGPQGEADAESMCAAATEAMARDPRFDYDVADPLDTKHWISASTGIIGQPLPMKRVRKGIADAMNRLGRGPQADADAAHAILTTDLVPKAATVRAKLPSVVGSGRVTLGGIAKGSGMIAPNMGTMLAFITTDADVQAGPLRVALRQAVAETFNRTSIDQHTSPSDMVLILSNPADGRNSQITDTKHKGFPAFTEALTELCRDLSYQVVRDGEGATRVFRVQVRGARSVRDADRVGKAVVDSPLVKCAVHGADPNWGRIVTAVGYSGAKVVPDKLGLSIASGRSEIYVYRQGAPTVLNTAERKKLERVMSKPEIAIRLDLNLGPASCEWLGCDLSREYIHINADYTT